MKRFLATLQKDLLLLIRDRAALVLLFLMPLALAIVISLVQDSTLRLMEGAETEILIVNHDNPEMGRILTHALTTTGLFKVSEPSQNPPPSDEEMRARIAQGQPKVGLILPTGATQALIQKALKRYLAHSNIESASSSENPDFGNHPPEQPEDPRLPELCFYSKMLAPSRRGIQGAFSQIFNEIETQILLNVLTREGASRKTGRRGRSIPGNPLEKHRDGRVYLRGSFCRIRNLSHKPPRPLFAFATLPAPPRSDTPTPAARTSRPGAFLPCFYCCAPLGRIHPRTSKRHPDAPANLPGSFFPILLGKQIAYLGSVFCNSD
jgi:hypothetical protein